MTEKYIVRFGNNSWYIGIYGHHLLSKSDFVFRKLLPIKESPDTMYAKNIFSGDSKDVYECHPRFLRKGFRISVVRPANKDKPFFLGEDPMKNKGTSIEEVYKLIEG